MELFRINFNYNFALADIVKSKSEANSLELSQQRSDLLDNFCYDWLTDESDVIPDFVIIMQELIGCKFSLKNEIQSILKDTDMHSIKIGKDAYVVFCNIPILNDCLNLKRSKITRFSDGEIMEIKSPVLLPGDYPALFQVSDIPSTFFCNQEFKKVVEEKSYTGLLFENIKIKSKSWF